MKLIAETSESSYLERHIAAELTVSGDINSKCSATGAVSLDGLRSAVCHLLEAARTLTLSANREEDFVSVEISYWDIIVDNGDMFSHSVTVSLGVCIAKGRTIHAIARTLTSKVAPRFTAALARHGIVLW